MDEKPTPKPLVVMSPIVLAILAVSLSFAWVIPNHTMPWTAFHSDAIASTVLLIVTALVFVRGAGKIDLIGFGLFFMLSAAIPWIQYFLGLVYSFGTAWISSLYLIGFSLAIVTGWRWEKSTAGQCLDFLFLAICLAGSLSIAIQLVQWFRLDLSDLWFLNETTGIGRFSANLGQPNQLASLFLLAMLGVAWGYARNALGAVVAIVLNLCFLFGVALTESRTAWLNFSGILVALFYYWGKSRPKYLSLLLVGFGIYSIALYFGLPVINDALFGEVSSPRPVADPIRLELWRNLSMAVLESPWFGYGWGQTIAAIFASRDFPEAGAMFKHAHNIVLELILYNGIVLGGLVVLVLGKLLRHFLGYLRQDFFIIPFLAVALLLVHSMLEYPLHYAYFLLPFGMLIGVLGLRSGLDVKCACPKWVGVGCLFVVAGGLWITIVDSLEAERVHYYFYFGKKGQEIPPELQPQLTVLTQWSDRLVLANSKPSVPLSPENYAWMKGVAITTPESFLLVKLSQNLALNGKPDEAREWLDELCKIAPGALTDEVLEEWESAAQNNAAYRTVDWKGCR